VRLYTRQPIGTVPRARQLRRDAPEPERRLLRALREAFPTLKWRHQAPVGPFYADILCFSEKLVVEVDGDTHAEMEQRDAARTAAMESEGFRLVRVSNNDVMANIDGVVETIQKSLSFQEREGAAQPRKGEDSTAGDCSLPSPCAAARLAPLPTGEGK
jgi:very-short-patch-repair endonuclease